VRVVICNSSGEAFDRLTARDRRDYDVVKAAVLADGGFNAFDATSTAALARILDRLNEDPEVVYVGSSAYPWVQVAHPDTTSKEGRDGAS